MRLALLVLFALLVAIRPAAAAEQVDVALVLVGDVSRSINDDEYKLEKQGYSAALTSQQVLAAITGGQHGAIAVAYVEFAGATEVRTVVDWAVIRDAASAGTFATALAAAPRSYLGRTAIGEAIAFARSVLAESGFPGARQVIDVCGDGTNNNGPEVGSVRDEAVEAGITVNGLAIINDHPVSWTYAHVQPPGGLDNYYRENVTGGVGSFVVAIKDREKFKEAIRTKLVLEVAGRTPERRLVPVAENEKEPRVSCLVGEKIWQDRWGR